jgi:SAM-dependent methyltransferase
MAPPIRETSVSSLKTDVERSALPFGDDTFETVLLCEVFEHLRVQPLHALREIRRVLASDGRLVLTTPNLYFLARVYQFLSFEHGVMWGSPVDSYRKFETKGHMGHVRVHTRSEVEDTVEACGFDVVDAEFRMMEWDHWERGNVDGVHDWIKSAVARRVTDAVPRLRKTIVVVATPSDDAT